LVNSLASDTTQQMIDLSFEFSKVLYGTTEPTKRASTCVGKVNNLLGYAVGAKYVEKAFDDAGKTEVEELISNLKTAFKSLVDDASWMDSATKKIAREKADAIREFIAYPDWSQNKTALEEYYKGLQVQKGQHFQNIQNVNSLLIQDDFETLRGPTDRTKWISPPSIVNAFYAPEYNSITFPAGILQSPYFVSGRIAALNYGAIGVVIGHEITHGLTTKVARVTKMVTQLHGGPKTHGQIPYSISVLYRSVY
jgi:predicted metalloendopeptidase